MRPELFIALFLSLLFVSEASAQSRVIVVLPEGAPRAYVDALVVELQLSGQEPIVSRQPEPALDTTLDLFVHSDATRAMLIDSEGRVVVADRDGLIAETSLGGALSGRHPRVVGMVAADLAARSRRAAAPEVSLPRVRLSDPSDALTPPAAASLSGQLGEPATAGPVTAADAPPVEGDPPREPWPSWLRVLTEISFGMAGSAVLGVPAALATDQAGGWLYGYAIAGPIGFSLGAWLGGVVAGGEGNLWWTLLGGLVGGVVAGGLLLAGAAADNDPTDGVDSGFTVIGGIALIVLPTTLSILGYELSQ